jgi:hypothetical protein
MTSRRIVAGPSKWDLLIEALARCKPVIFTLEGIGTLRVRILYIGPEDGSGDKWLINAREVLTKTEGMPERSFKIFYNSKFRHGMYKEGPTVDAEE